MDQNSTNDTDKRNWRERLGIGGKDMPRISGEFAKTPETVATEAVPLRPAQAVAKPAPMAPRLPMKAGPAPAAVRPQQQVLPQGGPPQAPDALAEKLRSQRAAAERLAEQRVSAAKQRAENAPGNPAPAKAPVVAAAPGEKPKFSFADEDTKSDFGREPRSLPPSRPPQRPAPQQPQLSPPRPPLGGQPRIPTGAPAAGFLPQYRPQPPRGYAPSAYVPPPSLQQAQRSFNGPMSQPPSGEPRLQTPRVNPDAYRRGPQDDLGYAGAGYETSQRSLQQRTSALRAPAYDDDYGDEIFEEAPAARSQRRASANDYNQAYRENEGAYPDERRRSSGPWLLLLFLMLAAGAAGAGVWYYQTNVKTVATNGSTDTAPVVSAPDQSAKSAPEQPPDSQSPGAAASKKQIYDRIIGDNEVLGGRVVPTEETPLQPESQQGDAEQVPQPAGDGFDSFSEGGDALPLPMPPPSGTSNDTQGALSTPSARNTAALSSTPTATNSTGTTSTAPGSDIAPVPGETAAAATTQQATPPAAPAPATEEIVNEESAPVVKKPAAKKTTAAAENTDDSLGAAPVVLVPPADPADGGQIASAPPVVDQPVATQPAPVVKKKKTLLGLFRGTNDQVPETQVAPAAPEQQVASIPAPAPIQQQAAPTQVASAGSGYFVQLASFKSESEASTEFGRLKAKYASIIGTLPSAINPATIGGSTRYRVAVGPLTSRDQATKICNSLFAAGERDCLVRKQ
ncbi:MAG TPA: SPOR domain-containing protein [Aestuariivirga sp.]|nr:SPOR domain-containing protein [Aestuariivirga sp.]